ncbi:zinc finger BED domain-containing protein 4 [Zeugodacus cucurbitae]|uniref:zinc finger BED domain-containing protein 4 n=1 Tax=Zeugodacus cucurbitae TaxID=28588 RepID=UPI0023D96994|nr:zinc finger BED domain-containing protein 4 [Zeugodacus cucurbitae]
MVELKGVGSSTAKNLAAEVLKVLNKYNINLSQIVSITSDNGANMLKTTNILSFVFDENLGEDDEYYSNDEYLKIIENIEKVPNVLIGNIQVCRCAAHTAQLVARDVTKSSDMLKYLFNCRNMTKFIRKTSNGFREIFELKQLKMPQLDCPTRWGSTYTMLKDLLVAKDELTEIESTENKIEEDNFEVDASLWDFIENYCLVFSPLQKTIKKFQEEQLHYRNFYAQWLKLKICTDKIVNDATHDMTRTIGEKILSSIEMRSKILLNNKFLISCLFLDPRFQHTLTPQQKNYAVNHLKSIWDRINDINSTGQLCSTPNSGSHQSVNHFFDEEDELLNAYLEQGIQTEVSSTFDVYSKIDNLQLPFQRIDADVLTFWKGKQCTDQELYALSNVCFAVPPTQVTIERAFSTLRLVLTDYRNRLSQEVLENILLVKLNPSFLDSAIDNLSLFQDDEDFESLF